ncbi:MAG: flavodoxin family protein [Desulfobulbus sp.]|jgi:multimeric flavodoxin WrbA
MHILILQGGARKKGNTAHVLALIEQQLLDRTHTVETIYLHDKNLHGCMGCGACKKHTTTLGCVQEDEVIPILEKMIAADGVIFSSPLYFWGVNAQLKTVIDRMFCLYTDLPHRPEHSSLLAGKKLALVMTGGGPQEENAEGALVAFQRMMPYMQTTHGGELFVGRCRTPERMDPAVHQQVEQFVQTLVG